MKGYINRFFCDRGYGFITAEDGQRYFCHISNIDVPSGQYPQVGQNVEFDLAVRYKGNEAVEVRLV